MLTLLASSLLAQQADGLVVRRDPNNVVAGVLLGEWRRDASLEQRLGSKADEALSFRDDATVVAKIPAAIAKKLRERPIVLAGIMTLRGTERPFVLTDVAGNPTVVWFRERDGDPLGDAESFTVMAVRAEVKQADLLFVGGDFNNQSFAPYSRERKVVGKMEPTAVLNDMAQLLAAGKTREFVETYVSPEDLAKVTAQGASFTALESRFKAERAAPLVEAFTEASKVPPTMNAAGDEASWTLDKPGVPKTLKLQLVDGRWYLRNR